MGDGAVRMGVTTVEHIRETPPPASNPTTSAGVGGTRGRMSTVSSTGGPSTQTLAARNALLAQISSLEGSTGNATIDLALAKAARHAIVGLASGLSSGGQTTRLAKNLTAQVVAHLKAGNGAGFASLLKPFGNKAAMTDPDPAVRQAAVKAAVEKATKEINHAAVEFVNAAAGKVAGEVDKINGQAAAAKMEKTLKAGHFAEADEARRAAAEAGDAEGAAAAAEADRGAPPDATRTHELATAFSDRHYTFVGSKEPKHTIEGHVAQGKRIYTIEEYNRHDQPKFKPVATITRADSTGLLLTQAVAHIDTQVGLVADEYSKRPALIDQYVAKAARLVSSEFSDDRTFLEALSNIASGKEPAPRLAEILAYRTIELMNKESANKTVVQQHGGNNDAALEDLKSVVAKFIQEVAAKAEAEKQRMLTAPPRPDHPADHPDDTKPAAVAPPAADRGGIHHEPAAPPAHPSTKDHKAPELVDKRYADERSQLLYGSPIFRP